MVDHLAAFFPQFCTKLVFWKASFRYVTLCLGGSMFSFLLRTLLGSFLALGKTGKSLLAKNSPLAGQELPLGQQRQENCGQKQEQKRQ
jgi:hypothetical protein